jgi:hypothetical protein
LKTFRKELPNFSIKENLIIPNDLYCGFYKKLVKVYKKKVYEGIKKRERQKLLKNILTSIFMLFPLLENNFLLEFAAYKQKIK